MQFDRRNFMKALLALPGIALAKILPPSEASKSMAIGTTDLVIDSIMSQTKAVSGSSQKIAYWINHKAWTIYWTGWKYSQTSISPMGQWVAVPIGDDGKWDHARHCLVSPTPGRAGTFRRGDVFNVAWHFPQAYAIDILHGSKEEVEASLEGERRMALEAMLDLLRVGNWHDLGCNVITDAQMASAWERLPKRSQFYLDADRYMMTYHGITGDHGLNMLAVQKQLFG